MPAASSIVSSPPCAGCRGRNSFQAAPCPLHDLFVHHTLAPASVRPMGRPWHALAEQRSRFFLQHNASSLGSLTQETLRLTAPPLLAWMEAQLRPGAPGAEARMRSFLRFTDAEEAAGAVAFSVKAGFQQQPSSAIPHGVAELCP